MPLFNPPDTKIKVTAVNASYQVLSTDSVIVVDPAQLTPHDITWTTLVNAIATGNEVHNDAGGLSSAVHSTALPALDDGYVEFTPSQNNVAIFAGFNGDAAGLTEPFAFALQDDGHIQVSENLGVNIGTYTNTDVMRVTRTGTVMTYSKNGVVIYTSSADTSGIKLYAYTLLTGPSGTGISGGILTTQGATITLPAMSDAWDSTNSLGQTVTVYRMTAHGVLTISGGAANIAGSASVSVKEIKDGITAQPDGTEWFIVASGSLSPTGKTYFRDSLGIRAFDIGGSGSTARLLLDQRENATVDWNNWNLTETISSPLGSISVDWGFRTLYDVNGNPAVDWNDGLAPIIAYTPANAGDWSPAPATVADALDQLAARVKALEP